MVFPGRFADQLVPGQLHNVSLSFLVDELVIRRGGVAGNIAYGLAALGLTPLLVAAVGADFGEYRAWLDGHGVDTSGVRVSRDRHTARFLCTTDTDHNQIASFYAGAMVEARDISLPVTLAAAEAPDLVVIGPNDPAAMLRYADECRRYGYPFVADPSQQLPRLSTAEARDLVEGARYLFTNEYESSLLRERTGWSMQQILSVVGGWVTTLGSRGARLERSGLPPVVVPAAVSRSSADPTGVGDAFRAGFLAGTAWSLEPRLALQLGCLMATTALEVTGTQEYTLEVPGLLQRCADDYGAAAAGSLAGPLLAHVR